MLEPSRGHGEPDLTIQALQARKRDSSPVSPRSLSGRGAEVGLDLGAVGLCSLSSCYLSRKNGERLAQVTDGIQVRRPRPAGTRPQTAILMFAVCRALVWSERISTRRRGARLPVEPFSGKVFVLGVVSLC